MNYTEIMKDIKCTNCQHFVGCECFDGKICNNYLEKNKS